jgi:wyosine [tRNA(Phe)-imidazoG37] synthetase (radical SAM superfamily)
MYTYGPVPSRRLGSSLGVSPIPPKTCSYSCIYCQLGRTDHLRIQRESFFPREDMLAEIIGSAQTARPDYVTFVGDGEPALYSDLGRLIGETGAKLKLPTVVITNGSLLYREDVREDLKKADIVIPTLDAGNEKTFRTVNRPHRGIAFDAMLRGQIEFRREYTGQIWLEVMLVKGINDTEEQLDSIMRAVDRIKPDRIYILTPTRPPAEPWVKRSDPETILKAQEIIGGAVAITGLESGEFGLKDFTDARQAILEIGSRHPLRLKQAREIEREFSETKTIDRMLDEAELVEIEYDGNIHLLPGRFIRGK